MTEHQKLTLGDLDLKSNSFVFTMSREQAIDLGHAKPTPEEVERYNTESRERWERSVEQWKRLDAFAAELAAIDAPLSREILNLHACAEVMAECVECSAGDEDDVFAEPWPCPTVRLVAFHHGITLPEGHFGSRPDDKPYEMPAEGFQPFEVPLARWHTAAFGEAIDRAVLEGGE